MKCFVFWLKFHWGFFLGSNKKLPSIGFDNSLAPTRWQAIIWTDDGWFTDQIQGEDSSHNFLPEGHVQLEAGLDIKVCPHARGM